MLKPEQIRARNRVVEKMRTGEYSLIENPCLCGGQSDIILAKRERFDIPIRTVLCRACGIVRSDPYYDGKTVVAFYENEYRKLYGGNAVATEKFFTEQEGFGTYIYDFLNENIFKGEIRNKNIFEIGCGAGGILETFRKHGNKVFGCDYGESYLEFGRKKGLSLVAGGSSSLKQFGKADIIILNHTLEHMTHLPDELKQVRELLSLGSILYIALPGIYYIHDSYRGNLKNYLQNAHIWYFTLKTLNSTLAKAGFELMVGDEKIMAVYKASRENQKLEAENPEKILSYLKKTKNLHWYYELKNFSIRHFAFETLRRTGPLYRITRAVYRKLKKRRG